MKHKLEKKNKKAHLTINLILMDEIEKKTTIKKKYLKQNE
jgi:hypothetical protein